MSAYSFQDVSCTLVAIGGVLSLGNGAATAEEGIELTREGDKTTRTMGADGSGMYSLHASKAGNITVSLLKTSPMNAKLQALFDVQSLDSTLWGKNVITVTNRNSDDIHVARQVAFKKSPDMKYANDGDIIKWEFYAIAIDSMLGTY